MRKGILGVLTATFLVAPFALLSGFETQRVARAQDAPAPDLRRVRPDTITAGAPTFTLRVEGREFVSGARILLDNVPLGSSRVNENGRVVLAEVEESVVAAPGSHTVKVLNPDNKSSGEMTFTVIAQAPELDMLLSGNAAEEDNQDLGTSLTGEGFGNKSKVVVWGEDSPDTIFVSETILEFRLTAVFLEEPARIPIMVRNKGGLFSNVDIFFVVPRPARVQEIDPFEITVGNEEFDLSVFGGNFKEGATIVINGTPLPTDHPRPGRLDTKVPASFRTDPAQLIVRVEQEGIQSIDTTLTVTPSELPFIFTISPIMIRQGENKATIDLFGANFRGEDIKVLLNGQETEVRSTSRRQISFRVPADLLSSVGSHTVQIKDRNDNLSNVETFSVVADVTVATLAGRQRDGFNPAPACTSGEEALFRRPSRLTIGPDGLLYVADQQNHAIRTVDPETGRVCTLVGTGVFGYHDSGNPRNFPPTFSNPLGIAVRSNGTIFLTENGNNVVRRIVGSGSSLTVDTLAGTREPITHTKRQDALNATQRGRRGFRDGEASFAAFRQPDDIVIAPDGSMIVSDTGNHAIRRIRTVDGQVVVETLAGNGVPGFVDGDALRARFNVPTGLAVSEDGNTIFIADTGNNRIRRLDLTTNKVDTFTGSGEFGEIDGPPGASAFRQPLGLAMDTDGTLYVAEFSGTRIRRVALDGNVTTLAGADRIKFRDGPGVTATFKTLRGIAIDREQGLLYVADYENFRIRRIALR